MQKNLLWLQHMPNLKDIDPDKIMLIIGAGPSGLVSARFALEYGFTPLIIEKTKAIGGLWSYGTWPGMQTNLSKFSLFSDLECDSTTPNFLSSEDMQRYLHTYANKFGLYKHILFNTAVLNVSRVQDYWQVTLQNTTGSLEVLQSKCVIVASGFFSSPDIPQFPGQTNFMQPLIHSAQYKNLTKDMVAQRKVVVIGNSFSAVDIVPELAQHAEVTHLVSKPHWILPRNLPIPLDLGLASYRRANRKIASETPFKTNEDHQMANNYLAKLCPTQTDLNHPLYIDPQSNKPPFVAISDHYLPALELKKFKVIRGTITGFDQTKVIINNHQHIHADLVICCTGYKTRLPFLDQSLLAAVQANLDSKFQPLTLYKSALHPALPNLGMVGMYRGPYFTIMELQARLVCMYFAGLANITTAEMLAGIEIERRIADSATNMQFPHGDFLGFAHDLAEKIGCNPIENFRNTHPVLHQQLLHAPVTATHFRLIGPNAAPHLYHAQFAKMRQIIARHNAKDPCLPKPQWLQAATRANSAWNSFANQVITFSKKLRF